MANISEQIYAGVVGKIIGVYLGRPVEGWPYEKISREFGDIHYYQNQFSEAPLIVPDDDISGTFAFIRSLEDNAYKRDLSAKQIGDSWLNYIIENQTILWWGGLSRSTEHTAFLRLKNGIHAPQSGSIQLNGRSMAEQIGAQIFIDGWALVNPNDPETASHMAREAASVSHDGIAVEAACYLAAMEAMAFSQRNINTLLDEGLRYIRGEDLPRLVHAVRKQCAKTDDWKEVRSWIEKHHGYDRYPGNCPMATNHLVVLMALLMAGDNFQRSISIAASAGWDTDCNAGNVGCLNGIRLGLDGIDDGIDLRTPVADRLYVVTSDGGSCISDAVQEARKLVKGAMHLQGISAEIPSARFAFEYPGSLQGFHPYSFSNASQALTGVENASVLGQSGLLLHYRQLAAGAKAAVCVETFTDNQPKGKAGTSYFDVLSSPTLYEGQLVSVSVEAPENAPSLRLFVEYFDGQDQLQLTFSDPFSLSKGSNDLRWEIPSLEGHMIYRIGLCLESECRCDGTLLLKSLNWSNPPRRFHMGKSMDLTPSLTPWTTATTWIKAFMRTAEQFYPDYTTTFSVSHSSENGVATIGTRDWDNYAVTSTLTLSQQDCAGLVGRARGHRRYYAAVLKGGCAVLIRRTDDEVLELAKVPYPYEIDKTYTLQFRLIGSRLALLINGEPIVEAEDSAYPSGGAGFLVESGAMLADGFTIEHLED